MQGARLPRFFRAVPGAGSVFEGRAPGSIVGIYRQLQGERGADRVGAGLRSCCRPSTCSECATSGSGRCGGRTFQAALYGKTRRLLAGRPSGAREVPAQAVSGPQRADRAALQGAPAPRGQSLRKPKNAALEKFQLTQAERRCIVASTPDGNTVGGVRNRKRSLPPRRAAPSSPFILPGFRCDIFVPYGPAMAQRCPSASDPFRKC